MKAITILFATMLYSTFGIAESPSATPDAKAMKLAEAQFLSLDADDDMRISRAEASAQKALANRFAAVDSNADGFISKSEFEARPSAEPFE